MMGLLKAIWNLIKSLFGFLSNHSDEIAAGGAAVGGVAAAAGAGFGVRAKKVNKKAMAIRDEALSAFQESNSICESVLGKLGDLQIEIIDTFDIFIEAIEKIQHRPEGLKNKLSRVTLPEYKQEELKALSNDLQMALAGAGGAVAGVGVGAAAFGINLKVV